MPQIELTSREHTTKAQREKDYADICALAETNEVAKPVRFTGDPERILIQQWPDIRGFGLIVIWTAMADNWEVELLDNNPP